MKSFFGYIRVSTQKQGQSGVSLQEQRAAIERYAQRSGLTIAAWFEERETAAKRGRAVFGRMLMDLRHGKGHGVIIHKIDRSARNLRDWADLGELIDSGIEVHFATESLDLHSRGGRLSADIQAVVAADYIRNLREETRKGFYGRLNQGVYPLPAPIGYRDMGKGRPKEPDPSKAPLVQRAFELYATGEYSLFTLRAELTRLGLCNRNGKPLTRNGLSTMLNNPFYTGLIRLRRTGETFRGGQQPIVSAALFKQVQAVLNGKTPTRVTTHDFLLRRMLRCKHCGYALIGEKQKGHVYYRCHSVGCPVKCVREEFAEQRIRSCFGEVQLTQHELPGLKDAVTQLETEGHGRRETLIKNLELQLSQLKARADRLVDAYVEQMIDRRIFTERKARLQAAEIELEEQLRQARDGHPHADDRAARFLELARSLQNLYDLALPTEKRILIEEVTSNRLVTPNYVVIKLKSPFLELANRHKNQNGDPYRYDPRTLARKIVAAAYSPVDADSDSGPQAQPTGCH